MNGDVCEEDKGARRDLGADVLGNVAKAKVYRVHGLVAAVVCEVGFIGGKNHGRDADAGLPESLLIEKHELIRCQLDRKSGTYLQKLPLLSSPHLTIVSLSCEFREILPCSETQGVAPSWITKEVANTSNDVSIVKILGFVWDLGKRNFLVHKRW